MSSESPEREEESPKIEEDIESLRSELGDLVQELGRRRHVATDIRLQMRRHPRAVVLIVAIAVLAVAGRLTVLRRRRAQTIPERAANLARVLALLSGEDPDQVKRAVEGKRNGSAVAPFVRVGAALLQSRLRPRPTFH